MTHTTAVLADISGAAASCGIEARHAALELADRVLAPEPGQSALSGSSAELRAVAAYLGVQDSAQ